MRANFSTTFNTEEEKKQSQSFEGRLRSSSVLKQEVIPVGRQCKNIHKYAEPSIWEVLTNHSLLFLVFLGLFMTFAHVLSRSVTFDSLPPHGL